MREEKYSFNQCICVFSHKSLAQDAIQRTETRAYNAISQKSPSELPIAPLAEDQPISQQYNFRIDANRHFKEEMHIGNERTVETFRLGSPADKSKIWNGLPINITTSSFVNKTLILDARYQAPQKFLKNAQGYLEQIRNLPGNPQIEKTKDPLQYMLRFPTAHTADLLYWSQYERQHENNWDCREYSKLFPAQFQWTAYRGHDLSNEKIFDRHVLNILPQMNIKEKAKVYVVPNRYRVK